MVLLGFDNDYLHSLVSDHCIVSTWTGKQMQEKNKVYKASSLLVFITKLNLTLFIYFFHFVVCFNLHFEKKSQVEGVQHSGPTQLVLYFTGATNILYTFGGHAVTV